MSVATRATRYIGDALRGVRRAPVEVLATLCTALTFSWALELGDNAFQSWAEVAVACALLLAVAWTATLLHATGVWNEARRWTFTVGGALVVAIYALTLADFRYASEGWRAALLIAVAVLWLVALPGFGGPRELFVDRMRRVDGRILLRAIGALLYGGALFAGLALALRAVDVLFELRLDEEIYGHVWGWIFFVLVPWIVLGGLPDYLRPIDEVNEVAGVARRIVAYLVPPLVAVYFLILYAYVVRILVTGEIPKNLVSPMVLAAGGLGALALLLFDPRPGERGLGRWLRLAPPVFLPLAPLGAWALLLRIQQYGWTEFRMVRLVALGALAALALGATVQLARRRPFALHAAPLALAVPLLLSAIGPWSVLALSRRSQQARLQSALVRVEVPPQDSAYVGRLADTGGEAREVPGAAYEQVQGSARYLAGHFGPESLPPVLRPLAAGDDARWLDYADRLGLRPDSPIGTGRLVLSGSLPPDASIELEGGTAWRVQWLPFAPAARLPRAPGITPRGARAVQVDSTRLALQVGDQVLHADLAPLLDRLGPRPGPSRARDVLPVEQAVLPVTDADGVTRGQLVVWHLAAVRDSSELRVEVLEALVVVRPE